jgi:hypothetical protein
MCCSVSVWACEGCVGGGAGVIVINVSKSRVHADLLVQAYGGEISRETPISVGFERISKLALEGKPSLA